MTSTHSSSRACRSGLGGQRSPVMCSLTASPDPSAIQNRPGNIAASVAEAWAMIAGWYRWPGALTTPNGSEVVASAAPSHDHANPLWPCRSLHGAKWSEHMAASNPTSSARCTAAQEIGRVGLLVGRVEPDDRSPTAPSSPRPAKTHGEPRR